MIDYARSCHIDDFGEILTELNSYFDVAVRRHGRGHTVT